MQAQTPEVSGEKATTPAAELRLVSVEQLNKIHRELDACQKVIWLAGCGQRGYGFDPAYVTGAQEQLKQIEALLAAAPAQWQQAEQKPTYVECRECAGCGHTGINDSLDTHSACSRCAWIGPNPAADKCPGCAAENVMSAACPKCGCIYRLLAESEITAPTTQPEAGGLVELPPLGESLRSILGRPNFACAGIAKHLRGMGYAIPHKAEEEQAATIHWLVNLYLKHGDGWATHANAALAAQDKQSGGAQ